MIRTFGYAKQKIYISAPLNSKVFIYFYNFTYTVNFIFCKMVCAGLLVFAVFPAAYVELPTAQLVTKDPGHQLRVYTAGVWHNLVLALGAWFIAMATPTLLHPLYVTGKIQHSVRSSRRHNYVCPFLPSVTCCLDHSILHLSPSALCRQKEP